eukprot:SAG25_NODE_11052_length_315_cov_0.611111_1_plen_29_part_10
MSVEEKNGDINPVVHLISTRDGENPLRPK